MTRILLPVLIAIVVVLLASMLAPAAVPEWLRRIRALDDELESVYEWERQWRDE